MIYCEEDSRVLILLEPMEKAQKDLQSLKSHLERYTAKRNAKRQQKKDSVIEPTIKK